jgi:hypothetical protein
MTDKVQPRDPGFLRSVYDGAIEGDFSDNRSLTKRVTQIGVGFIPIVGQVADARDTASAVNDIRKGRPDGWKNLGWSLAGWLPFVGDLLKNSRKVGARASMIDPRSALESLRQSWREIADSGDVKLGKTNGLFYEPKIELGVRGLPRDTNGLTNKWGDVQVSKRLKPDEAATTLDHELVHSALSPKFIYGQESRANVATYGYYNSHFLRRAEEGLAEGWARFKSDGIKGLIEGWKYPYQVDYGLDPAKVKIEAGILVGVTAAGMVGAAALGARESAEQEK